MKSRMESKMSSPVVIGVDIGKEVFHLGGFAADGKIAFRRRIRRLGLRDAFEKLPPCIVRRNAHWNTERQTVELGSRRQVPRSGAGGQLVFQRLLPERSTAEEIPPSLLRSRRPSAPGGVVLLNSADVSVCGPRNDTQRAHRFRWPRDWTVSCWTATPNFRSS